MLGIGVTPCTGLKKGLVTDLSATTAAIRDAISKAETMADEDIRSVYAGITGEHIACMNSRSVMALSHPGGEVTESDVERLLESARAVVVPPDREIIHAIPRSFTVDGQTGINSPIGMHANRLEVETHIVTGLSSLIHNVVKCVRQAGCTVQEAVLEPIATAESVLLPAEKRMGAALIDIGGGTSDLVIYIDGQVYYSAVIPVGGNHVTRDISIGLRTELAEAEKIKLTHGCTAVDDSGSHEILKVRSIGCDEPRLLPKKILAEIIEPRMSEICGFGMDHMESAGCLERIPAGLIFTGGGSLIPGFRELAAEVTGLPVRIGKPAGLSGMTDEISGPMYSTAVGLVIYGSRYCDMHVPSYAGRIDIRKSITKIKDFILEQIAKIRGD